jgi:hypothetical protein
MGISNTIPPSRLIQPGVVANTAARPTSPFTGQAIYQVDTNQYLIWNGTAWTLPTNMPWGFLGVSTLETNFTTSSPHTTFQDEGLSTSVTYGANRRLRVTLSVRPYPNGGTNFVVYRLLRGSTTIANWGFGHPDLSTTEAPSKTIMYTMTTPSTAATETFKVQISGSLNTAVSSYGSLWTAGDGGRQLTIEDIGPA